MSEINVKISLSCTVSAQRAPSLLQELLAMLPKDGIANVSEEAPTTPASWPSVPASAGDAYRKRAEKNFQELAGGQIPEHGWGKVEDLRKLFDQLPSETRKVVLHAIANGGHISRDEVYEVLDRDKDKSLNGFTKPAARLTRQLVLNGSLPSDAKPLLTPIYDKSPSFQQAQGFVVPLEVVLRMKREV